LKLLPAQDGGRLRGKLHLEILRATAELEAIGGHFVLGARIQRLIPLNGNGQLQIQRIVFCAICLGKSFMARQDKERAQQRQPYDTTNTSAGHSRTTACQGLSLMNRGLGINPRERAR
jgi:hypothetical protein